MSELSKLHAVLRLAHTSSRRFHSLRLTIRDWADHARICEAQGLPCDPGVEPTEEIVRLWIDGSRMRFEDRLRIEVRGQDQWWVKSPGAESADSSELQADDVLDHWIGSWSHFWDVAWLRRPGARVVGRAEVAGRPGFVVETTETGIVYVGTERDRCVIDAERGILLRIECMYRGDVIAVEEAVEVAFDEQLPDELFEEPQ